MSTHTHMEPVTYHICDACGHRLTSSEEVANRSLSLTIYKRGAVEFEWFARGDYCGECLDALAEAICEALPVPERYNKTFQNKSTAIAIEAALIRDKRGIEVTT